MRTTALFPEIGSAMSIAVLVLAAAAAAVTALGVVAWHLSIDNPEGRRRPSRTRRRALHAFAEATATGRLDVAELEASRVLSRNDR